MKRIAKRSISFFASVLLVLLLLNTFTISVYAAQGDEVRAAKKIISLVYDDSGSMMGDPWGYANYATQGLMALLNEQDELFITYLSEPDQSRAVDTSDLQGAVNAMHDWEQAGGTPAEALYTARNTLDRVIEEDPSVEYWLMVMTDGGFYDFRGNDNLISLLKDNAGDEMPNHSTLRVAYLGMGAGSENVPEDESKGLYSWNSGSNDEIIAGVNDMAGTVSGRIMVDNAKQVNDTTISFSSELPLYSISVLSQNSKAIVKQAKTREETLKVVRNIGLDANTEQSPDLTLNGNAAVINKLDKSGDTEVIPADTYELLFSEPVDISNLVIQYEPAIGLLSELKREGITLDVHNDTIRNADVLDVSFTPVIPGTDAEIPVGQLPKGISWEISYRVGGAEKSHASDRELTGLKVEPGHNEIICTMKMPGFSDVVSSLSFDVEDSVVITNLAIETDQPENLCYKRSALKKKDIMSAQHVRFILTNDGVPLTKEDLENAGISLAVTDISADESKEGKIVQIFGIKDGKAHLVQNDDGSYALIPETAWGLPLMKPLTKAGYYEVTVEAGGDHAVTASGSYRIESGPEDWLDIPILIAIILFILYLFHTAFIRERFPKCSVQLVRIKASGEDAIRKDNPPQQLGLAQSLWPPFKKQSTCRCKAASGLVLIAEDGGVSLKGKSMTNAGYNCYGTYHGKIPKKADRNTVKYERVLGSMERAYTDDKGRISIDNQNIPTGENLLIFCKENDKKVRRNVTGISQI